VPTSHNVGEMRAHTMRNGIEFSKIWSVITDAPLSVIEESAVPPQCKVPGVKIEYKKAWIQLMAKNGNRMYIAKTKMVRQIDLSGFGAGLVGTEKLRAPNGMVQAHLDLSDDRALFHLFALMEAMGSMETAEKKKASPMASSSKLKFAKEAKPPVDAKTSPLASLDAAAATERLHRLIAISKLRGAEVSETTVNELLAQGATLPTE